MFLTRIGFGSTAVITGDVTQVDLPRGTKSGLAHVVEVLRDVPGISFTHFKAKDVVRHPLVQRIVEAYDRHEQRLQGQDASAGERERNGRDAG
ncbi:PhoH-like protein [compost metagenome]